MSVQAIEVEAERAQAELRAVGQPSTGRPLATILTVLIVGVSVIGAVARVQIDADHRRDVERWRQCMTDRRSALDLRDGFGAAGWRFGAWNIPVPACGPKP